MRLSPPDHGIVSIAHIPCYVSNLDEVTLLNPDTALRCDAFQA